MLTETLQIARKIRSAKNIRSLTSCNTCIHYMHLMLTKWNVIFIRIYTSYTFFSLTYTHIHTHTYTHLYRFLQLGIGLFKSNGWCGRNISILIGIVQCMMFLIFQWKSALVSFSFFEIKNSYIMSAHKMMESSFSWWSTHQSEPQESTRVQCYTVNYAHILLNGTTNKCRKKIPLIFFFYPNLQNFELDTRMAHNVCSAHRRVCVCNASSFSHDEFELLFLSAPLRASTQFVHIAFFPCHVCLYLLAKPFFAHVLEND